jgi:putative endonuclease
MPEFAVYILSSDSRRLYVGVTSDLLRRVGQHKLELIPGFTTRYQIKHLVYFELTPNVRAAIEREKEIKSWTREKKIRLIEKGNPGWLDLAVDWFPPGDGRPRKG